MRVKYLLQKVRACFCAPRLTYLRGGTEADNRERLDLEAGYRGLVRHNRAFPVYVFQVADRPASIVSALSEFLGHA